MASFNKVILLGNLTRDPEVRYTPKGSAVCDLGLAVNRAYTLDNGEKREEVTLSTWVLWARLAEIAGEYLKKGRPVLLKVDCNSIRGTTSKADKNAQNCASSEKQCSCSAAGPQGRLGAGSPARKNGPPAPAPNRRHRRRRARRPNRTTTKFRFSW